MKPFFSIVIPTRDRLDCLEVNIKSVLQQDFDDFEIIVSDNGVRDKADGLITRFRDGRIKYNRPSHSLGLCDNFEFASTFAEGEWVMFFGDKNVLYSDTLKKVHDILISCETDILNFPQDYMSPFDPGKNILKGKLKKNRRTGKLARVNIKEAIENHLNCIHLKADGKSEWYIGSIHSGGMYHREFIEKIRKIHTSGRLFDGVVPDRYGALEALCIAENVFYLDDSLCVYNSCGKNTWRSQEKKGYDGIVSFIKTSHVGYDISESLEIPGVVGSVSNIIATDYRDAVASVLARNICKLDVKPALARGVLAAIAHIELSYAKNIDAQEIRKELELVDKYVRGLSSDEKDAYTEYVEVRKKQDNHTGRMAQIQKILYRLSSSNFRIIEGSAQRILTKVSKNSMVINDIEDFVIK